MDEKRLKLPHRVIVGAPSLLPMLYKVSEISNELNVPERTIRDWLAKDAPHQRDSQNCIWVNGQDFAAWVFIQSKNRKRRPALSDSKAFCFKCNEVVEILNRKTIPIKGKLVHFRGNCPLCGTIVNRGGRIG